MHFRRSARSFTLITAALVSISLVSADPWSVPQARADESMPVVDFSRPLSVDECVRLALKRSYSVRIAEDRRGMADANRLAAYGGLVPSLSVGYDISTGKRRSFDQDPPSLFSSDRALATNNRALSVSASQTLVSLPVLLNISVQKKASGAAQADVEAAELTAAYAVRQQYYALVQAMEVGAVRTEDLNLAQEESKRTSSLFEVGSVARTDVLKSKVRVAEAQSALTAGLNNIELERARLAIALAMPAETRLQVVVDMAPRAEAPDSVAAYAAALDSRPELRAAHLRLESARTDYQGAKAEKIPSLGHSFSMNRSRATSDDIVGFENNNPVYGKTKGSSTSWTYRIGLSWNILDRLVTESGVQRAKNSTLQSRHALEEAELNVGLEVKQALLGWSNATSQVMSAREAVTSAEEDLKLSQERYGVGLGTILELIDARVALTRARTAGVQAMASVKVAEAALDKATGRRNW